MKSGRTAGFLNDILRVTFPFIIWVVLALPVQADVIYTVEEGNSAWSIAIHFGVSLDDLYNANGWADDEDPLLQIGQHILIPSERDDEESVACDDTETSDSESSEADTVTVLSSETTCLVQPGDNPYTIAHRYGIGTLVLLEYNGLREGDLIHPGQLLSIPPAGYEYQGIATADESDVPEDPVPEPLRYRVATGDNMWLIARRFSVNLQNLLAYNNLNERSLLQVGDEILIPAESASLPSRSLGWFSYTVVAGDTLGEIAQAHGVSLAAITEANNIGTSSTLRIGQELRIPGYRSTSANQASTTAGQVPAVENIDFNPSTISIPSDLTSLPDLGPEGDGISDWHSEIFDFRQIAPPEPSTPAAGTPASEGGYSIDGHFDDGTPWHRYTIRRGDTISQVAGAFGITQSELLDRNGLDIRSPLRIGRDLRISLPRPNVPARVTPSGGSTITYGASGNIGNGTGSDLGRSVVEEARKYLGLPYVWAGTSLTGGMDCSGFTMKMMEMFGVGLPHRSRDQATCGIEVGYSELAPGDLVFFHTTRSGISHVGIYIGSGDFIHSSSHRGGVVISPMDSGYYWERFVTGRRVF